MRDVSPPHGFIKGIAFHEGNEQNTLGGQFSEQIIVIIAPIIDNDSSRIELESLSHFDIRYRAAHSIAIGLGTLEGTKKCLQGELVGFGTIANLV